MEFDSSLPLAKARTAPSQWYTDPAIFSLEEERVFRRGWHYVGIAENVAQPGQFLTARIGKQPVLVVRNQKGTLNAMANVCRHKAAVIMTQAAGKAACLSCRYHGWTYDLSGNLRSTPQFEGVEDFSKEEQRLPLYAVESVGPFVFVSLDLSAPALSEYFRPFVEQIATLDLEKLVFAKRVEYDLRCNWKVFVDNYLDGGYHINTLHPGLAGVVDDSRYRTDVFEKCSLQSTPLVASGEASNVRKGNSAYYWWLHPTFMVNIYEGVLDTNLVVPTGPETCRVYFDYFFSADTAPAFIDQSIHVAHQVQMEDQEISESVQQGLASGSYQSGRFSVKREVAGYHFHRLLAGALDLH